MPLSCGSVEGERPRRVHVNFQWRKHCIHAKFSWKAVTVGRKLSSVTYITDSGDLGFTKIAMGKSWATCSRLIALPLTSNIQCLPCREQHKATTTLVIVLATTPLHGKRVSRESGQKKEYANWTVPKAAHSHESKRQSDGYVWTRGKNHGKCIQVGNQHASLRWLPWWSWVASCAICTQLGTKTTGAAELTYIIDCEDWGLM